MRPGRAQLQAWHQLMSLFFFSLLGIQKAFFTCGPWLYPLPLPKCIAEILLFLCHDILEYSFGHLEAYNLGGCYPSLQGSCEPAAAIRGCSWGRHPLSRAERADHFSAGGSLAFWQPDQPITWSTSQKEAGQALCRASCGHRWGGGAQESLPQSRVPLEKGDPLGVLSQSLFLFVK